MKYAPAPQPARYEILLLMDVGSGIKDSPVLVLWHVVGISKLHQIVHLTQEVPTPAMFFTD